MSGPTQHVWVTLKWRTGVSGTARVNFFDEETHRGFERVFAVYSAQIMANGWQPYDQPGHAAYVARHWSRLKRVHLDDEYTFVWDPSALFSHAQPYKPRWPQYRGEALVWCTANDLLDVLLRLAHRVGVRDDALLQCAAVAGDALANTNAPP